ncbi:M48 family metalloprotease [Micromonospora costi]|uniref:M48 family metalloprotease n=1 Tax=Micromonospora costi TaxID=1530042 RepID=UPI0034081D58
MRQESDRVTTTDRRAPTPAPAAGPRVAPAAFRAYFALLVGAVLASSVVVFLALDTHLGDGTAAARLAACADAFDAAAAEVEAAGAVDDEQRRATVTADFRACLRPVLARPIALAGAGVGLLILVAVALYLAEPWWIVRRNRARRLPPDLAPGLADDLTDPLRHLGLDRAPEWWLAPLRPTAGGRVFGLPGRRCVLLDAGLLVLRATDRAAFRAVVAHELAHLRNRDVDLTYLTVAVWRAFLLVAALPVLVLLAHPGLLREPTRWRPAASAAALSGSFRLLGLLLALTCLVYLLRNAALRTRETYADVVAASADAGRALPAVLERLPRSTRWLDRWGAHPPPGDRLRAVRDPATAAAPSHGELVAAGLPAGVLTTNLSAFAGGGLGLDPVLGVALLGLVVGPWLGALLALAVWRGAWAQPAGAGRAPFWLTGAAVLVGSFLVGARVSLGALPGVPGSMVGSGPVSTLIAGLLLTVAAVVVAAWADSTARAARVRTNDLGPAGGGSARRGLVATLSAAGLAGGTGLAVWLPYSAVDVGFASGWGPAPADGHGWYAVLGMLTTADLGPAYRFVNNPLTLPALTALWLLPVALAWRTTGGRVVWHAALLGLVGGAATAVIGALLPLAAGAAVPAPVRQAVPLADEISFGAVLDNTTIAVGSVLTALAMAVAVAGRGPLRPARALLAATVTTVAATAAIWWVAGPVRCQTGIGVCRAAVDVGGMARTAHWILVQGLLVAVPLVLAAALVSYRARPVAGTPLPRRGVAAAAVGLAALLVVVAVLIWGIRTSADEVWLRGIVG